MSGPPADAPALDRAARQALAAALVGAATLALFAAWSDAADAPGHWARARWGWAPTAACLAAGLFNAALAWRRRGVAARWVPLAGGAALCGAVLLGRLVG